MKIKELRKKNKAELESTLAEKRKALVDIKFGSSGSKAKDVKGVGNIKKDIAQIMTLLKEVKNK
jgi:ribosomal protein L29